MDNSQPKSSRRLFVKSALALAWAAIAAALGMGIGAMLRMAGGGASAQPAGPVNLGSPQGLAPGQVRTVAGAALGRDSRGYFALKLSCPHLGCRPAWDQSKTVFLCPCHGSSFSLEGARLTGPAKQGLAHAALKRDAAGEFIADISRTVKPETRIPAPENA